MDRPPDDDPVNAEITAVDDADDCWVVAEMEQLVLEDGKYGERSDHGTIADFAGSREHEENRIARPLGQPRKNGSLPCQA